MVGGSDIGLGDGDGGDGVLVTGGAERGGMVTVVDSGRFLTRGDINDGDRSVVVEACEER